MIGFALAGCKPSATMTQPTRAEQHQPTTYLSTASAPVPDIVPSLESGTTESRPTITPVSTNAPTPVDTLVPENRKEIINHLLREPVDCAAPCFWGIVPGQTSSDEARSIFSHFGIQTVVINNKGEDFYNFDYDLDSGLSISVVLPIKNNLVETATVTLVPDLQKEEKIREWSAYSPETLINRYGSPSKVDFAADWGPSPLFVMEMYFDSVDLIVQYAGNNIIPGKKGTSTICPLTAQFDSIRIWMGKDPLYPPGGDVSIEKVTSMTVEKFSKLMTGDPDHACFNFYGNVFP
jgi:hypothetical protein